MTTPYNVPALVAARVAGKSWPDTALAAGCSVSTALRLSKKTHIAAQIAEATATIAVETNAAIANVCVTGMDKALATVVAVMDDADPDVRLRAARLMFEIYSKAVDASIHRDIAELRQQLKELRDLESGIVSVAPAADAA